MRELTLRVRDLIVASDQHRQSVAAALGLGVSEVVTLGHLYHSGELTPTAIAEQLGVTTASVTGLLDRLAGAGYVVRSPNPRDRRSILVRLTDQGTRTARASFEVFATDVETALPGSECAARLDPLLHRVASVLKQRAADREALAMRLTSARDGGPVAAAADPDHEEDSVT